MKYGDIGFALGKLTERPSGESITGVDDAPDALVRQLLWPRGQGAGNIFSNHKAVTKQRT